MRYVLSVCCGAFYARCTGAVSKPEERGLLEPKHVGYRCPYYARCDGSSDSGSIEDHGRVESVRVLNERTCMGCFDRY